MANGQIKGAGNAGKGARIGYYEAEHVGNNLTVTEVDSMTPERLAKAYNIK